MSGYGALQSSIAGIANLAAGLWEPPRFGLVTSYDPDHNTVKVQLQPEGTETGWLPIKLLLAGSRFGVYCGPEVGDQAVVLHQEGDPNSGFCAGFLPSDEDPPPTVQSGEILIIAKGTNASVKFDAAGNITSKGTWTHTGTFHATGSVTTAAEVIDHSDGASGVSLKTLRDAYQVHKHTGVQTGVGVSGTTDHPV